MPHPSDFTDAHCRHLDDAELLFDRKRWANADQLYGFSAECGLKAVMTSLGMPVDATGTPTERGHRQHVQRIWPEFECFVTGKKGASFLGRLPRAEPFADWSHHDRYANQSHFKRANVELHRKAALAVRDMTQHLGQDDRS